MEKGGCWRERMKCELTWKNHIKDLNNMDTEDQVVVYVCGFGNVRRAKYFGELPIKRI